MTVTYAAAGSAPLPRVGYAVNRRVGNAVTRNRLRRRLRAAVDGTGALAPGAYLVGAGPGALDIEYEELKNHVATAMTAASRGAGR